MQDHLEPVIPEDVIAKLYPQIRPENRREAAHNLARYIRVTLRIFDRIREDPAEWARFEALTRSHADPTLKATPEQP